MKLVSLLWCALLLGVGVTPSRAEFADLPYEAQIERIETWLRAGELQKCLETWRGLDPSSEDHRLHRNRILVHLQGLPPESDTPERTAARLEMLCHRPITVFWKLYGPEITRTGGAAGLHAFSRSGERPSTWSRAAELSVTLAALANEGMWHEILEYETELSRLNEDPPPYAARLNGLLAAAKAATGAEASVALDLFFSEWRDYHEAHPLPAVMKQMMLVESFGARFNTLCEENLRGAPPAPDGQVRLAFDLKAPRHLQSLFWIQGSLLELTEPEFRERVDEMLIARHRSADDWLFWLERRYDFYTAATPRPRHLLPHVEGLLSQYPEQGQQWMDFRAHTLFRGDPISPEAYEAELALASRHLDHLSTFYLKEANKRAVGPVERTAFGALCEQVLTQPAFPADRRGVAWKEYLSCLRNSKDKALEAAKTDAVLIPGFLEGRVPPFEVKDLAGLIRQQKKTDTFLEAYLEAQRQNPHPHAAFETGRHFLKHSPRAIELMELAQRALPSDPVLWEDLVQTYRKLGREADADALEAEGLSAQPLPEVPPVASAEAWWERWKPTEPLKATSAFMSLPPEQRQRLLADITQRLLPESAWLHQASPDSVALGNWLRSLPDLPDETWILGMKLAVKGQENLRRLRPESRHWDSAFRQQVFYVLATHDGGTTKDPFQAWIDTQPPVEELQALADLMVFKHWRSTHALPLRRELARRNHLNGEDLRLALKDLLEQKEWMLVADLFLRANRNDDDFMEIYQNLLRGLLDEAPGRLDDAEADTRMGDLLAWGAAHGRWGAPLSWNAWLPFQQVRLQYALRHNDPNLVRTVLNECLTAVRHTPAEGVEALPYLLDQCFGMIRGSPQADTHLAILEELLAPYSQTTPGSNLRLQRVWMKLLAYRGNWEALSERVGTWLRLPTLSQDDRWGLANTWVSTAKRLGRIEDLLAQLHATKWPEDHAFQRFDIAWMFGVCGDVETMKRILREINASGQNVNPFYGDQLTCRVLHSLGRWQECVDHFRMVPAFQNGQTHTTRAFQEAYTWAALYAGSALCHLGQTDEGLALLRPNLSQRLPHLHVTDPLVTSLIQTPGFLSAVFPPAEAPGASSRTDGEKKAPQGATLHVHLLLRLLHPYQTQETRSQAIEQIDCLDQVAAAIRLAFKRENQNLPGGTVALWMPVLEALALAHPGQAEPLHLLRLDWAREFQGTADALWQRESRYAEKFSDSLPPAYRAFLAELKSKR